MRFGHVVDACCQDFGSVERFRAYLTGDTSRRRGKACNVRFQVAESFNFLLALAIAYPRRFLPRLEVVERLEPFNWNFAAFEQ